MKLSRSGAHGEDPGLLDCVVLAQLQHALSENESLPVIELSTFSDFFLDVGLPNPQDSSFLAHGSPSYVPREIRI